MGFADSLGFGRTATFRATVTVHELLQVPLLNAKFRIKWKFRGATSALGGASDDASTSAHAHRAAAGFAGVTERFLHPLSALSSSSSSTPVQTPRPSQRDSARSMSRPRSGSPYGMYSSEDGEDVRSPTQSPPLSPEARTFNANRTPGPGTSSAFAFNSPFSNNAETLYATPSTRTTTHDSGATTMSPDGPDGPSQRRRGAGDLSALQPTVAGAAASAHRPEPKGSTTFIPLRAHTAVFNREITCPVQVALRHLPGSSKYQLQPSPVRLAVKQEVLSEDGKREEERLGEIILDLSQFATPPHRATDDARPRRYLLQDCKSNAVLRVSVKMEWVEGEKHFVAPQLRTGQIPTNSSAAKGLGSGANSPGARSSASLAHKAVSIASSSARLSSSSYARSTSASTASVHRSNSTSSVSSLPAAAASSGPNSAASSIAPRNGRRPKKTWHPSTTLSLSSTGLPATASTQIAGSGNTPDRSAADIVETIFNRPARRSNPDAGTDDGATRPPSVEGDEPRARDMHEVTEGKLGEPFELRAGRWKASRARRAAARASAVADGSGASSKAWSMRSFGRDKQPRDIDVNRSSRADRVGRAPREDLHQPTPATYAKIEAPAEAERKRERSRWLRDVTHGHGVREGHRTHPPPQLDVHVQPPTPRAPIVRTLSSPTIPAGAPSVAPSHRPPSLASTTSGSAASTKPLSVRWGDQSPASSAPTPPTSSPASSSLPSPASADRRSLRGQRSADSLAGTGLGVALSPGRGEHDRPVSRASFTSLVTPPSPVKRAMARPSSRASGKKAARQEPLGQSGIEWGRSWG